MDIIATIFGEGDDLNALQMSSRSIVIFIIALVLIRISGRRSFGLRSPLDNIVTITLGGILSRAIAGVSPFWASVCASLVLVILHRILGWYKMRNEKVEALIEGKKITLFKDKTFIDDNLRRALVSKEDVMQGVRTSAETENMDGIATVYMERNGEISAIKKTGN